MSYPLSRRALLQAACLAPAFAAATASRPARADARTSRLARLATDARGITATLELAQAPFPVHAGGHQDASVHVFIPHHHRVARDASVATVVHFHGHNTTAERALTAHQLREQLFESKQNAILVVPQLAVLAPDSSAGKLEAQGGFARMLADAFAVLDTPAVRAACGPAALPVAATVGRTCVSAHSGGYHAAAAVLRSGGLPVAEVYLFDALYAEVDVFRDWVLQGRGKPMSSRHKLVSYFTAGHTEANTRALFGELEKQGVGCVHEQVEGTLSRAELTLSEAVSIRTQLTHGAVTSELNGLRDCLYASALRRNLRSSWFDAKHGKRPLERRR